MAKGWKREIFRLFRPFVQLSCVPAFSPYRVSSPLLFPAQPFFPTLCPTEQKTVDPRAPGGLVDETQLLARLRAGEPEAQRSFYDQHVDRIFRLAYRMTGDDELARDFTQEAFIRAFDRIGQFRGDAALGT